MKGGAYRGNRRGKVELCLPVSDYSVLAVVPGVGWSHAAFDRTKEELKIVLQPFVKLMIRVSDASNKPAPYANVRVSGVMWQHQQTFFWQVSTWNSRALTVKCDAHGKSSTELILWPGQLYSVSASDARGEHRLNGRFNLTTDAFPEVLQLTLVK